jgi:hypothetical protein
MKRLIILLGLLCGIAQAQTAAGFGPALTATTQIPSNYVRVAPLSPMVVCAWPPTGGTPCTNKITTYTDPSESVSCPASAQVLSPGSTTCQTTSDVFGNFEFFAASPSTVAYYFKVSNTWNGPFVASIGGGTGVGTGATGHLGLYTSGTSLGSDANLDDGITAPGTITSTETIAAPQYNVNGCPSCGLEFVSPGGTLSAPGSGNGSIGIGPGAIPQINPNNAGQFAIPYITINGTALANTANNTNFSNSSPTAPTNGLNVQWNFLGQNISAAIVGDGNAAHCLLGTGSFGACGSGSAGAVSALTAATGSNTIANGNFPQTWNNAQTSNSQSGQTFGETSAATGGTLTSGIANQAEVTVSVASGSTATPLSVVQGSVTGTTAFPLAQFQTTWNNAGLTGEGVVIGVTDTASTVNSAPFDIQKPLGSSVYKVDKYGDVAIANLSAFGGNAATANITLCGGNALGQACVSNTNGTVGGITVQGSDNSSNGASAKAGYAIYRCGALTNATPNAAALPGVCQLVEELEKGSAVANVGDVVCMGTVAFQVTDCSHTGPVTNIIGIASSTSNPISVVVEGDALVKVSNTAAIGDYVCWTGAAGTDGVPVDNGTTACAAHQNVGIVVAISGTLTQSSGTGTASTAMSTSLPLVQLHIGS